MPTIVIVVCAASAGIHAALAPEHFSESSAAGVGFAASALVLAALAVVLTLHPENSLATTAAAIGFVGLLASYALAVTTGVPLLHPEVEPVAGLALATKATEATGLLAAVSLLGRHFFPQAQPKGAVR